MNSNPAVKVLRVLDLLFLPGFWLFFVSRNGFEWLKDPQDPLGWSVVSLIMTVAVASYIAGGVVGLIVKPFGIYYREAVIPRWYHFAVLILLILLSLFLAFRWR